MKKHLVLFISALMAVNALHAQDVQKVSVGDVQSHGVTYTLPKISMQVTVTAKSTEVKAGIFAQYAEKYLGLTDAPLEDSKIWEVTSLELSPVAVPDTSKTFHIVFTEKAALPTFYLNAAGSLLSINCEPKAETKTIAEEVEAAEAGVELTPFNVMNEELLKAGSKAKQAEIAARQIFRIRESRLNLLTGEVDNLPADGASFQLILDNLKHQEEAYMQLFTGTITETSETRNFAFVPVGEEKGKILFRFSRHFGFVDSDDLSGEPYMLSVTLLEDNRKVPERVDAKGKKLPMATGVAYCVPGKARVAMSLKGRVLLQTDAVMGQFGHVEHLDNAHFVNKKAPASAQFNAMTGAITLYSGQ